MYVDFSDLIECTLTSVLYYFLLLLLVQLDLDNRRSHGLNVVLPIRFLLTFKAQSVQVCRSLAHNLNKQKPKYNHDLKVF